ncbi:hypothetical protein Psuf_071030 [Phytohabitans suffuscus]|uniref:LysR substrate-binding domain-containing protein n=1 Tax=Phytohabitans suffuscus TaxID=624315 RepID=A0A6F8YUG3_9ACTN|nr:LysR substrate-binding domain-containing protein [Phytohabitans suffuscus]BCB89790.1 hypothetical protein Psuf_071030 [Phytohabitans suffuscus]
MAGIVSVGVLESLVDVVVPPLVAAAAARYPGVQLRVVTAYSGHLQQWLDDGEVDLSLLYNLAGTPSLAVVPLVREDLWAVAPTAAGLAPDRPVTWARLLEQPMVLPVAGHGLRVLIDQARASTPVEPRIAVEANSMHVQKKLVVAGHGWTVLPAAGVADDVAAGVLSGAPLTEPELSRSVVLGLPRGMRTPPPVEAVAATLGRLVRALVHSGAWPSARLSVPAGEDGG